MSLTILWLSVLSYLGCASISSGIYSSVCSHIISVSIIAVHFPPLGIRSDGLSRHSHRGYALGKLHPQFVPQYALELETKVREDFTITEKGASRGLLRDFKIFAYLRSKL